MITFEIKTGYYLEVLIHEAMKFYGSAKSKKIKDKNGKTVPHLEITAVVLVHCNITVILSTINVSINQVFCKDFFQIKPLGHLLDITRKIFIFLKIFNSYFSYN